MNTNFRKIISWFLILLMLFGVVGALTSAFGQQAPAQTPAAQTTAAAPAASPTPVTVAPQQITREGIAVEFQVEPVVKSKGLMEAEDAHVRFKVTDTATKTPVTGLNLSAWMALREGVNAPEAAQCREKAQSFMQGSLRARPDVDLNAYYILALNTEPNISVIDPLLGFGGSKLLTLVMLRSPGEDWALTSDRGRLFVSMPFVNQVAVVDTTTWKVVKNIDTGIKPTRVRLQPDERYLWVGNDGVDAGGPSGVTVIDAVEFRKVADIQTGAGHHEIAFSPDNRTAFVTNQQDSTLSVVDVTTLAKQKDVKVGERPVSVEWSPLSGAVYAASEGDGTITVVDGKSHAALTTIAARPGLRSVRFAPGGRYGFAVNPKENAVFIFDASTNRMLHTVSVGKSPDQVTFTGAFAYVHSAGSEQVDSIRLATVGKELDLVHFPGGQLAPNTSRAGATTVADLIAPSPEGNAVLVANPADRIIYYYTEGMAAPMGNFQNYKREPRSVMVVDRSLRESAPGVYSTVVKLPKGGTYDVAFLSDSPRIVHCFEAAAAVNPAIKRERQAALRIEYLTKERTLKLNQDAKIRFKLIDTATGKPKDGLQDVRVLFFLSPGTWQTRNFAQSVGEGVYEITVRAPETGVYMLFVESASQGVAYRQLPYLMLQVPDPAETTPAADASAKQP
ncbi:MAG TPA: cytochrome D1 domain-containing protein [Pyrinomonadaceae bacterium]|nr:cytochrome D1 domain-containing protein [Pyrinomonadaceae bacterium]